jgi:hypothetical protein
VQTFLPYPDFTKTAKCLDYKRLGKQRVECKQILNALYGYSTGWTNHPATKMWRGHEVALQHYANTIIQEWINRGYNNTMPLYDFHAHDIILPLWLGQEDFHASHRSNLLRKDWVYYSRFDWKEPLTLPYVWPA